MKNWVIGLACLALLAWFIINRVSENSMMDARSSEKMSIAVEVESIRQEPIELRRRFNATLESPVRIVVVSRVGGRVFRLDADLADLVEKGQIVAELDSEEYEQETLQAQAEVEVRKANFSEAKSNLEIAEREMGRVTTLQQRGIATESQFDSARALLLTRQSEVEVAKAQISQAEAALAGTIIRLGYTSVKANWPDQGRRVVAERHVNEGDTVTANSPLFTLVKLDPLMAVIFVTERDYGLFHTGQTAEIMTDSFPEKIFEGHVSRVAPVFSRTSRQARVELVLPNPDGLLKPGMFVSAEVVMSRVAKATTVPLSALVSRGDQSGIFVLNPSRDTVRWCPVETGIRQRDRVQVSGQGLDGEVVTLGQQLIEDGSSVVIPESSKRSTDVTP